jgi:hypothetical protein
MKLPPLPSALRSTVAERASRLEQAVEHAVECARRLDEARAAIGMGPHDRLFVLATELDDLLDQRIATIEAERVAKLSHYERDKLARQRHRALDGVPSLEACTAIVEAARAVAEPPGPSKRELEIAAAIERGEVTPLKRPRHDEREDKPL